MDGSEEAVQAAATQMSTSMNSQEAKSAKKSKRSKTTAKTSKKREREDDDAGAANGEEPEQPTAAGAKQKPVNDPIEVDEDVEAASRAELRKRRKLERKKQQQGGEAGEDGNEHTAGKVSMSASSALTTGGAASIAAAAAAAPKSGHGVWVGNLSFKTNPDRLKEFFSSCGPITRMNMPKGANNKFAHNKGFAYVDFEDPVGVIAAVGLSEQNLDGRRLLIKDAKSYEGRPKSAATEAVQQALQQHTVVETPSGPLDAGALEAGPSKIPANLPVKTLSKTARRILDRQKNVPAPTLFLGNLGYEVTSDTIKELFEAHFKSTQAWAKKKKYERRKKGGVKGKDRARGNDGDSDSEDDAGDASSGDDSGGSAAAGSDEEGAETAMGDAEAVAKVLASKPGGSASKKTRPGKTAGIRRVRLGTFEDTGKCKGWAFVDFHTTAQSVAALIDGRNHQLNGRTLKVEFASADAVRRGGGHMDGLDGSTARDRKWPRAEPSAGDRRGAYEEAAQDRDDEEPAAPQQGFYRPPLESNPFRKVSAAEANAAIIQAGGRVHKPNKAERMAMRDLKSRGERDDAKKRMKPGQALAEAKREKLAIQPSQGKKVVFD